VCGNRSNFFSHRIFDLAYLTVETRTGLIFHPSCLIAELEEVEEITEIDLSPFYRLIGLDQYIPECQAAMFDRKLRIHRAAELGKKELARLKSQEKDNG